PILALEVPTEIVIVVEPPEGRPGEEQIRRPPRPDRLELGDCFSTVSWIVTGVASLAVDRKVPPPPPGKLEQGLVPPTDDCDGCPVWQQVLRDSSDLPDQLPVLLVIEPASRRAANS